MKRLIFLLAICVLLTGCYQVAIIKKPTVAVIKTYPMPNEDMRYQFIGGYPYPVAY